MNQASALHFYKIMKDEDILLCYRGEITEELLSSIYQIMETKFDTDLSLVSRKRLYHIIVECLQNVFHHSNSPNEKLDISAAIFMIVKADNSYKIFTGNHVITNQANSIAEKIESINKMDSQELKQHYRNQLGNSEFSDKGTAGLGMIDIALKSKNKLQYSIEKISEEISFYTLIVTITL
jgi:hypothetical protein